jgi:hypothetical protein
MINNILNLVCASESRLTAITQNLFEKVPVIFFLRRRVNQARIRGRVLWFESTDILEVSCISYYRGDFLDLFELVRVRISFHKLPGV